jgi:hypothetical protein
MIDKCLVHIDLRLVGGRVKFSMGEGGTGYT